MQNENLKTLNVEVLGDRVIIIPDEGENRTSGGIIIPDTAQEKPKKGTIVKTGRGGWDDEYGKYIQRLNVGDKVIYSKYAGSELKINGTEYVVLREADVMMVYPATEEIVINY